MLTAIELLMVVSLFAFWYFRRQHPGTNIAIISKPLVAAKIPRQSQLQQSRWSFINAWQVTPQYDDRQPALVLQSRPSGFAPADRSTARRNQQRMYRQWSGERHD
jgi:hypothetical protein